MVTSDLAQVASALGDAAKIGGLLDGAARYYLGRGGTARHARPAIACIEAVGVCCDDHVAPTLACKLVHQTSAVHDDVQDESPLLGSRQAATAKCGALIVPPVAGSALLGGFPGPDSAGVAHAARILGKAYQASDDGQDFTANIISDLLNGVIARGLVVAGETGRARGRELQARGRLGQLSPAETVAPAPTLQSQTAFTLDRSLAWLSSASAGLRGHGSPRCRPMIPMIHWMVRAVAGRMTLDREIRHAA